MDPALTERITQEVIAALRRLEASEASGCCGEPAAPARVFITADELRQRLTEHKSATLELAANERLTPAAQDLVQARNVSVTRKAEPAALPQVGCAPAGPIRRTVVPQALPPAVVGDLYATGPVGLITHRADEKVLAVLAALERAGTRFVDCTCCDCWTTALTELCQAIAGRKLALGVAILPYAADAVILANKHKGIRAVQGTRVASVASAVRHVGANLLILEHALSTFHELRAMAHEFVHGRDICGAAASVLGAIAEAERAQ